MLATILLFAALVCFAFAALGLPAYVDLMATGLALGVGSVLAHGGPEILWLALVLFAIAAIPFKGKPGANWTALGLLVWGLSLVLH